MAISVAGPRMRVSRVHDDSGRLMPEFIHNFGGSEAKAESKAGRKRGSALINVATALLFALAISLYIVSISAQYRYVVEVKHNDIVAWIEAASLDGGMAVFTLLASACRRAGQSARTSADVVQCALGSAAMNLAAAATGDVLGVGARPGRLRARPPLFLAVVVDRTVSASGVTPPGRR